VLALRISRLITVFAVSALACGKTPAPDNAAPDAATSTAPVVAKAASSTPPPPAPALKKYTRVLQTGDSMVGGGLSLALRPKFEADGAKYHRDVIESGTIHEFAQNDHLPKLIASIKPDLILLTLGANHVPHSTDPEKEIGPYLPKLLKRVAGIDCYWIAPPLWKPSQAKFNEWLRDHVAPCRFYDGTSLEIARRPDKIHPTEKGGEVWANDFWQFYKGEGAFLDVLPSVATKAQAPALRAN
jgi:lysophospholipase L1-like esterase